MRPAPPTVVMRHLERVRFPTSKERLLQHLRRRAAPEAVRRTLESLTERRFEDGPALEGAIARRFASTAAMRASDASSPARSRGPNHLPG